MSASVARRRLATTRAAAPVVDRAIDRHELPAECDAAQLLSAFRAPLFYRLVTTGDAIDDELIRRAAAVALLAARAGAL